MEYVPRKINKGLNNAIEGAIIISFSRIDV